MKKIAVLGYGSQGRAQAMNLKDSGFDVVIGLREGSSSFNKTKRDGLRAAEIACAVKDADVICFLVPDEVHGPLYERVVKPHMKKNAVLGFAHGLSIAFNLLRPKPTNPIFMVAPKVTGYELREKYCLKKSVPCFVAAMPKANPKIQTIAMAYAKGIGSGSQIFETTFKEEAISNLFGEQAVKIGGIVHLMKASFETLVRAGISAEMAYFECVQGVKCIIDIVYEEGISSLKERISPIAHYGGLTRGKKVMGSDLQRRLKDILQEIKSGQFTKEWLKENDRECKSYKKLCLKMSQHRVEKTGKKIREQMRD